MFKNVLAASTAKKATALPVHCVRKSDMGALPDHIIAWAKSAGFTPGPGSVLLVPGRGDGGLDCALIGIGDGNDPFVTGALANALPAINWFFESFGDLDIRLATIGFLLGAYRFDSYKRSEVKLPKLVLDTSLDRTDIVRQVEASWLVRDLVNTPTNDMGPDNIEAAARSLVKSYKATVKVIKGDDLLTKNFPMIHAVGRASTIAPRLIDISWGNKKAPKLTLVGKGVAFDTGGLDIKPANSMRNMKKDMGGAAHVLGLAKLIMDGGLNVRLRVLIPAVENAISGNAFRPGDVLSSRKGLSVEIGHTDAEGRLVLGDALTLASEENPDLIIDMATLTGAARVALGPDVPPFYTNDDGLADAIHGASVSQRDPLWRMPLWAPYNKGLSSHVADLCNVTTDGFAGSVTAALFLQRFVSSEINWVHFDVFAWNPSTKPYAPIGGEAQGIRALYSALTARYA